MRSAHSSKLRGLSLSIVALLLVAIGIAPAGASAYTNTDLSGAGVSPVKVTSWSGDPTCANLDSSSQFPNVTSPMGVRVSSGSVVDGTYFPADSPLGMTVEGGAWSDDPYTSFTFSGAAGGSLGWSSTLAVQAVIVKGTSTTASALVYQYAPAGSRDSGLHAPVKTGGSLDWGSASSVRFCFGPQLTAAQAVDGQDRYIASWTVDNQPQSDSVAALAGA
ncbi:MAG: hypothetical protein F2796_02670, partial [Actinobacteria bacterium]|nr:hypothetical protein [Actinomycetota bacterium]